MSDTMIGDGRPTLAEEARARARARILSAALELLARRGFDTTVDEIAAAAGVSRRTVFRHFDSQAQLLAAASVEVARAVEASMPAPPAPGTELDAWLLDTLVTFHRLQARVIGEAFWDSTAGCPAGRPAPRASPPRPCDSCAAMCRPGSRPWCGPTPEVGGSLPLG